MLKNSKSDLSILFDLEYRGIDDLLSKLNRGIEVPESMIPQIKSIIKKHYDIELEAIKTDVIESGCYCLVEYVDEVKYILKAKY